MGQTAVPTAIEELNPQLYLLKPLEAMYFPELKHPLEFHETMKVEEPRATTALQEMAKEITEPLKMKSYHSCLARSTSSNQKKYSKSTYNCLLNCFWRLNTMKLKLVFHMKYNSMQCMNH